MKQLLDTMIEACLHHGDFVGANAAVYRNYDCIYENSFGMADRERGLPMQKDTIFRIYSMTKPVTAVAVMQLVEQGKLHPDFPVSWYLPEFQNITVYDSQTGKPRPAREELRVQHLLNMTSGMPYANSMNQTQKDTAAFYYEMEQRRDSEHPVTLAEYCRRIAEIPLEFDPGTHWDYGTSADVLGGIVQAVSGMDYREYLFQHIFRPLGMTDTDFYVPEEKQNRFAMAYEPKNQELVPDLGCHLGLNNYQTLPAFISGGAGLCSTVPDYSRFATALANGGVSADGTRIISEKALKYIRTPQIGGESFRKDQQWDSLRGYDYGCLVRVLTDQAAAGTIANLGEFGWDGWTGTYFCVDPAEKLVIFFWIQTACAGTSAAAKLMRNIVYGKLES